MESSRKVVREGSRRRIFMCRYFARFKNIYKNKFTPYLPYVTQFMFLPTP